MILEDNISLSGAAIREIQLLVLIASASRELIFLSFVGSAYLENITTHF
jgi:hypothetical protein